MSLRIIAGRHRGRRIETPTGLATRPTSDRAREALFAILEHGEPPLRGARFLDLFSGSGAVGLEAVSRGAASALCIDQAGAAVAAIRRNVAALGEEGRVEVSRADACRLGAAVGRFGIAFLDPPYGSGLAVPALAALVERGWLAPGAQVVVETAQRETLEVPSGLVVESERRYGAARFVFLRAEDGAAPV
ncbi:MAG: 16S rRNA (guanine(966)-N(2))-methyltransferase RsmD [Geminicoccaceae bacterium]